MAHPKPEPIKPMPFPGESPTVALALLAGEKYGVHPEEEKPDQARPKRRASSSKHLPKATRKATPAKKAAAGKAKVTTRKKAASSKKAASKRKTATKTR